MTPLTVAMAIDGGERASLITLALIEGVGAVTLKRILQENENTFSKHLASLDSSTVQKAREEVKLAIDRAQRLGARVMTILDADYPPSLSELYDPPPLLFVQGNLQLLSGAVVAVVGTRNATRSAERVSHELGMALSEAGACVVSGLARGVDSAAHRGALLKGGSTCAVLGTGLDISYPAEHNSLQQQIAREGVVLAEAVPGQRARRGSFPKRNRIVAALARLTIVVEAGHGSGALITAECAADLGRTVGALPGPVDSPQSQGSNLLLRDGAHLITSVDDAISLAGLVRNSQPSTAYALSAHERSVVALLARRVLTAQQLVELARMSVEDCLAAVTSLEVAGVLHADITGELRVVNSAVRRMLEEATS